MLLLDPTARTTVLMITTIPIRLTPSPSTSAHQGKPRLRASAAAGLMTCS